MAVILTELLHTEQAVQLSGLLLAVKNIVLAIANWQLLVGAGLSLVGEHGVRAVHRLCGHRIRILAVVNHRPSLDLRPGDLCIRILQICDQLIDIDIRLRVPVDTRHNEHVVQIVCPVPADKPQTLVVDQRRRDLGIAMLSLDLTAVLHERLVHLPPSRQPVRHPRSGLVEHEELELRADLAVITLLRFLDHLEVRLELVFRRKRIQVDSLQLVTLLVPSPVRHGGGVNLERCTQKLL